MSLRQEIKMLLGFYPLINDKKADEIINKVLDAAIGAAPNGINGGDYDENDYAGGWNQGTQEFIEAIQALKNPAPERERGLGD